MRGEPVGRRVATMATTQRVETVTASGVEWLTPVELRTLEAICEALLPSVAPPAGEDDAHGLYARSARDLQLARQMAETVAAESPEARADFKKRLGPLNSPLI